MSALQAIATTEFDRESPLTGAVISAPANNSVMEKMRERTNYLHEVFFGVGVASSILPLTTDKIHPDAMRIFDGTPAGGDGIRGESFDRPSELSSVVLTQASGPFDGSTPITIPIPGFVFDDVQMIAYEVVFHTLFGFPTEAEPSLTIISGAGLVTRWKYPPSLALNFTITQTVFGLRRA